MPNNNIQSLWVGEALSAIERLSIRSFLHHGHEYHLFVYQDVKKIPEGVILQDANEILPESDIFSYPRGGISGFSNWFRYELLYQKGGYWVDTDIVCLKPFDFEDEYVFGWAAPSRVSNAVLRFSSGNGLMKSLSELCRRPNTFMPYDTLLVRLGKIWRYLRGNRRSGIIFGETGPKALTSLLRQQGMISNTKPVTCFFPIPWSRWMTIFDNSLKYDLDFFSTCYSIHLYHDQIRRAGFDKDAKFHERSLIEILKSKYL